MANPFENHYKAWRLKVESTAPWLITSVIRISMSLGALTVGALGFWDMANKGVICALGISPRYAHTMRGVYGL